MPPKDLLKGIGVDRYRLASVPCLILLGMLVASTAVRADSAVPNVILMMADDMGLGDTSAYQDFTGNTDQDQIDTPQMRRLASMGVRFTDAHTPSSRCSPTRYGLLTGRYPWRNRLKYWVLFGAQGDPMIEADRPTLATLFRSEGYRTGIVGKWHVGLRYRKSDGRPADGWQDADLTRPLFDGPLDHGFDFSRITSRSHGTSGATGTNKKNQNNAQQTVGPGHLHGRFSLSATSDGKRLVEDHPNTYLLHKLGSRHSDHAIEFLNQHLSDGPSADQPFFLYYPSNSNHGPYTPDDAIGGVPVAGAARNMVGQPMDVRSDYIYENDVALGRLLDFLQSNNDPRLPGKPLIDNTIVIFTSDNGAEKNANTATGPFRSHKGSAYEGGHRVPFLVAWPAGGVGDGSGETPGQTNHSLIGLQDMFATFADVLSASMPDLRIGEKGGEDSHSVLAAWRGQQLMPRPMFFNDHSQAADPAAVAMRWDNPVIDGEPVVGQWKVLFEASLLRQSIANPLELYNLSNDSQEQSNLIDQPKLKRLIEEMSGVALRHRRASGHRLAPLVSDRRFVVDWTGQNSRPETNTTIISAIDATKASASPVLEIALENDVQQIAMSLNAVGVEDNPENLSFGLNARGMGIEGNGLGQVNDGESIEIRFDRDVVIESVSIVAGNGQCGGFYQVADGAPLAIYCIDADIDAKDQSGVLSDMGVLRSGQVLRLSSMPHYGVESAGRWRLGAIAVRVIE